MYEIVKTPNGYNSTPSIVVNGAANAGFGANLVADASGNLFTTTKNGGANSDGSVLEITGSGFATTPTITPIISDIFWQNDNGQAGIWEMNGTNILSAAAVGSNPGPSWKLVGTSDFNGSGHSDLLWQNASGQAGIWEMNGTNVIGEAAVSPNPGPSWDATGLT